MRLEVEGGRSRGECDAMIKEDRVGGRESGSNGR